MASDVTPIERLANQAVPVDARAIESEFARIWDETAAAGTDESSIRLRVMNFVAIGLSDDAESRFEQVMAAFPERHPCRGILASVSPEQSGVSASISAHCWRGAGGGRHVCSEEVLLVGGPGDERALASAVLALLVPELPVAVWIIGTADFRSELVQAISDEAERVFVDSGSVLDLTAAYGAVLRGGEVHDVEVSDMAWCRLINWRSLIAQLFDGADARHELESLKAIEITSSRATAQSEALLLAGWLLSRLDLSVADVEQAHDRLIATLYDGINSVRLSVSKGEGSDVAGIHAVTIQTGGASFSVELHETSGHMHVREEWPESPVHRTVAQLPVDDATVFGEALDDRADSAVYLGALRAALTLLGEGAVTETFAERP